MGENRRDDADRKALVNAVLPTPPPKSIGAISPPKRSASAAAVRTVVMLRATSTRAAPMACLPFHHQVAACVLMLRDHVGQGFELRAALTGAHLPQGFATGVGGPRSPLPFDLPRRSERAREFGAMVFVHDRVEGAVTFERPNAVDEVGGGEERRGLRCSAVHRRGRSMRSQKSALVKCASPDSAPTGFNRNHNCTSCSSNA